MGIKGSWKRPRSITSAEEDFAMEAPRRGYFDGYFPSEICQVQASRVTVEEWTGY